MNDLLFDTIPDVAATISAPPTGKTQRSDSDAKIALAVSLRKSGRADFATSSFRSRESDTVGTQDDQSAKTTPKIPWPRRDPSSKKVAFVPLQEWEGYVTEVGAERFSAQLVDKTRNASLSEELVELPLSDIRNDDLKLLKRGAVFRWTIGYQNNGGTKERVSRIIFRRLPAWKDTELTLGSNQLAEDLIGLKWK